MIGLLICVGTMSFIWFQILLFMSFFNGEKIARNFTKTLAKFESFGTQKPKLVSQMFHKVAMI